MTYLAILAAILATTMAPLSAIASTSIPSYHAQSPSTPLESFMSSTGTQISDFAATHLQKSLAGFKSVFYPFGGPDVLFPMLLMPQVEKITLVGLEPVGQKLGQDTSAVNTDNQKLIQTLLEKSFFITANMWSLFEPSHGVVPALIYQIQMCGGHDIHVDFQEGPVRGACIRFVRNGLPREIHYYRSNMDNNHFDQAFMESLSQQGLTDVTLLKATSYLPHQNTFSKVRDFILTHSQAIVQNDSGIPLKPLQQNFKTLELYGDYTAPYGKEFTHFTQKDLIALYKAEKRDHVPFCFGYGCRRVPANLMVALKQTPHLQGNEPDALLPKQNAAELKPVADINPDSRIIAEQSPGQT